MSKEFLSYNRALKLKQLGFDEPCFGYHYTLNGKDWKFADNHKYHEIDDQLVIGANFTLLAPTFSQAFDWLLDKHSLYAIVIPTVTMHWTFKTMTVVQDMVEVPPYKHVDAHDYSTKKKAELACLDKLIEIVELKHEIEKL
jgi:hypothetical protein